MASPVTIQPATADTYLYEGAATTNYGTSSHLNIQVSSGAADDMLLKFDFHASVPAGATITLATLSLYGYDVRSGRTIACYRLRRTDWVLTEATWNIFKASNNWGTAGALNTTTDIDTTNGVTSASLASAGWQNWTITAQVQSALDSYSGIAHFFLKDTGGGSSYQVYGSSRYATTTLRPKLYIEYTVPSAVKPNFIPFFWA